MQNDRRMHSWRTSRTSNSWIWSSMNIRTISMQFHAFPTSVAKIAVMNMPASAATMNNRNSDRKAAWTGRIEQVSKFLLMVCNTSIIAYLFGLVCLSVLVSTLVCIDVRLPRPVHCDIKQNVGSLKTYYVCLHATCVYQKVSKVRLSLIIAWTLLFYLVSGSKQLYAHYINNCLSILAFI